MILRRYKQPSGHDSKWRRKFLWKWTIVQTMDDFSTCRTGTELRWLEFVWRQNVSATAIPIYRYVVSETQPG